MTWTLGALVLAATAAVTFSLSALTGGALALGARRVERLTPAAQARVALGAAVLPLLLGSAIMIAALAPSFGWIRDHCASSADVHEHPHLCDHHVSVVPAGALLALAAFFIARVFAATARLVQGAFAALSTARALREATVARTAPRVSIVPIDAPQAFVIGVLRPEVFVSRGLASGVHREHLAAVLSHEEAHVLRRDPLRRSLATFALAFHLPGIAVWLDRRLGQAQEMAADAEAARAVGSEERVALALVRLARARNHAVRGAMAFAGSDVEARVATLLDHRTRNDHPHAAVLVGAFALLFAAAGIGAGAVHHGVEMLLGVLGG